MRGRCQGLWRGVAAQQRRTVPNWAKFAVFCFWRCRRAWGSSARRALAALEARHRKRSPAGVARRGQAADAAEGAPCLLYTSDAADDM
eukprot:9730708-Alexandrium_andersonii.AAC.1